MSRGAQQRHKKGAARLQVRAAKPASSSFKARYVPASQQCDAPTQRSRIVLHTTSEQLQKMNDRALYEHLVSTGHLSNLSDKVCLWCQQKSLGNANREKVPQVLQKTRATSRRCGRRECNAWNHPLFAHPCFVIPRRTDIGLSLQKQARLLFHAAWNTQPLANVRAELGLNECTISDAYARWRAVLKVWVEHKQASIRHGGNYEEAEVDEVILRKRDLPGRKVAWTEYVGLKTRGDRESLVLRKRPASKSVSTRAEPVRRAKKGRVAPPPLTKAEWLDMARDHCKDKLIVHADGAVAYDAKPADMDIRKDSVNHGCRNGGPYYTKKATHKHLKGQPVGKNKKATVAGTQSLDGWWKSPKMNLRGVKSSCEDVVDARVAQSQWHHWIGNKDPWKTQGEVLKAVRDLQLL